MLLYYMGMKFPFFNILIGLILASSATAAQPVTSIHFKGMYECSFSGIPFARVGVEAEQTARHYSGTGDIQFFGIVNIFTKHSSHTTVDASGNDFTYNNIAYETRYRTNKKRRYVNIIHKNGQFATEKLDPPESYTTRQKVPDAQKKNALDPFSTIFAMRQKAIAALKQTPPAPFNLSVYDGRRLTQVDFEYLGRKTIRTENGKAVTHRFSARRKPINGFTEKEQKSHNPKEAPLIIYFSDDALFWPMKFETSTSFGTLAIKLLKQCRTGESCLLGNKE